MKDPANTQPTIEPVQSVAVIGLGLIGGSILKDIERHSPQTKRYGWSNGRELTYAREIGLIEPTNSLAETIKKAEVIIIATPIPTIDSIAREIKKCLPKTAKKTITELGSVKGGVRELFASLTTDLHQFVQTHPMGGSEKTGFEGSKAGLFREKPWLICVDAERDLPEFAQEHLSWLLASCGALKRTVPAADHDRMIASVSHMVLNLSHVLFDFVTSRHPDALAVAGESFVTSTRLASDNPEMIYSINQSNADQLQSVFDEFLEFAKDLQIYSKEEDYFAANRQARDYWIHQRRRSLSQE